MYLLQTRFPLKSKTEENSAYELDLFSRYIIAFMSLTTNVILTLSVFLYAYNTNTNPYLHGTTYIPLLIVLIPFSIILNVIFSLFPIHVKPSELKKFLVSYKLELFLLEQDQHDNDSSLENYDYDISGTPSFLLFLKDKGLFLLILKGLGMGAIMWFLFLLPSLFVTMFILSVFIFVFNLPIQLAFPIAFLLALTLLELYALKIINQWYEHSLLNHKRKPKGILLLRRRDKIQWDQGHVICPSCGTVNNINVSRCILCHSPLPQATNDTRKPEDK